MGGGSFVAGVIVAKSSIEILRWCFRETLQAVDVCGERLQPRRIIDME
jgi:hypothetical protein